MVDVARARKLAVRIREVVSMTLEMQVKDPRLGMVTITDAKVTPDLREATLYYTVYGDDAGARRQRRRAGERQGRAAQTVGQQTGVRYTPSLQFIADVGAGDRRPASRSCWRRPGRGRAGARDRRERRAGRRRRPLPGAAGRRRRTTTTRRRRHDADARRVTAPASRTGDDVVRRARGRRRVALACHVGPDGDALGSMLALGLAPARRAAVDGRRVLGRRAVRGAGVVRLPARPRPAGRRRRSFPRRAGAARHPRHRQPRPARRRSPTGSRPPAACVVRRPPRRATPRFGTVNLVDDRAAATAVLVAELLDRLGVALTPRSPRRSTPGWSPTPARSATPRPRRRCTTLAARLLATGIRHDLISRAIYDTAPLRLRAAARRGLRARRSSSSTPSAGSAWSGRVVPADDLAPARLGLADVEGVIDVVRTAREAEVAVVLKEDPVEGGWKVSTRSQGRGRRRRGLRRARRRRSPLRRRLHRRRRRRRDAAPRCARRSTAHRTSRLTEPAPPPTACSSSTSRPAGPRTTSSAAPAGWPAPARSATPARSTRWPPACWCSASAGPPGCWGTWR